MPDLEVRFRPVFIIESGRLRVAGLGVVSKREEGRESAIAGVMKRKGRRQSSKDRISTNVEVEFLEKILAQGHKTEAGYKITESCCVAKHSAYCDIQKACESLSEKIEKIRTLPP